MVRCTSRFVTWSLCILTSVLAAPAATLQASELDARSNSKPKWKPGLLEQTVQSGDDEREYLVHIPKGFKAGQKKTLPLVLMLHGRTSSGRQAASGYYGWRSLADKESFIAVFPTALGSPTSWEGAWRGTPTHDSIFLSELIDLLKEQLPVDENRVFMTGHSSGGFMSFSFAATHSAKIAAIGPVAGLVVSKGAARAPVSVVSFHGTADRIVAYDNEKGKNATYSGMPSAMESAAFFAQQNGCDDEPKRTETSKGRVFVDTWSKGKSGTEVVLYSIEGGNHGWPKGGAKSVDATGVIWEFFKAHPRSTKVSGKSGRSSGDAKGNGQ